METAKIPVWWRSLPPLERGSGGGGGGIFSSDASNYYFAQPPKREFFLQPSFPHIWVRLSRKLGLLSLSEQLTFLPFFRQFTTPCKPPFGVMSEKVTEIRVALP